MNLQNRRRIIEKRYKGLATIKTMVKSKVDGETVNKPVEVVFEQPCLLTQPKSKPVNQKEVQAEESNTYKILIAPEIDIPPGSEITVVQKGVTYSLSNSGKPYVCDTHQEISVEENGYV